MKFQIIEQESHCIFFLIKIPVNKTNSTIHFSWRWIKRGEVICSKINEEVRRCCWWFIYLYLYIFLKWQGLGWVIANVQTKTLVRLGRRQKRAKATSFRILPLRQSLASNVWNVVYKFYQTQAPSCMTFRFKIRKKMTSRRYLTHE